MAQDLGSGARERHRIDAGVTLEPRVLVGLEHGEKARIDVGGRDRQAPAAVIRREGAQQLPIPVEDDGRALFGDGQIERAESSRDSSTQGLTSRRSPQRHTRARSPSDGFRSRFCPEGDGRLRATSSCDGAATASRPRRRCRTRCGRSARGGTCPPHGPAGCT